MEKADTPPGAGAGLVAVWSALLQLTPSEQLSLQRINGANKCYRGPVGLGIVFPRLTTHHVSESRCARHYIDTFCVNLRTAAYDPSKYLHRTGAPMISESR